MKPVMRELIERLLGPRGIMRLRRFARGQERPRWGNLRRLAPFSTRYGFGRGTPVDRYYRGLAMIPAVASLAKRCLLGSGHYVRRLKDDHGFASSSEPPLERSRLLMLSGNSAAELAHRLSYSWRR